MRTAFLAGSSERLRSPASARLPNTSERPVSPAGARVHSIPSATSRAIISGSVKSQPLMPHISPPMAPPMATVGLDTTMDGKPNIYITGVDHNFDGIPDVLQESGMASPRAQIVKASAPVLGSGCISVTRGSLHSFGGSQPASASAPAAVEMTCSRCRDVLTTRVMEHSTKTTCSECSGAIQQGDILRVCMPCEYAVCPRCQRQAPQKAISGSMRSAELPTATPAITPTTYKYSSTATMTVQTSASAPTMAFGTQSQSPTYLKSPTYQMTHPASRAKLTKCVYVTLHQAGGRFGGKVRRKTLYPRGVHNNEGYWAGKDFYLFAQAKTFFGQEFVISKLPPGKEHHLVYASSSAPPKGKLLPPEEGWDSEDFDQVTVTTVKPKDWVEGNQSEARERVAKFVAALKKPTSKDGKLLVTIHDVCAHIDKVKEHLPELLKEFPKIDVDGDGEVSLEELNAYFDSDDTTREYSQHDLDDIWEILTSNREDMSKPQNMIDLEDIGYNLEYIEERIPALTESFPAIDTDRSCTVSREEFDAFFGDADTWLEKRLQSIIGLGTLKERINTFYWQQRLDRLRRRGGAMVTNEESLVMMFKGSPGTGKTTIGRLITGLLHKIGVIEKNVFVECQRDELVGDHIGATEKLTAGKIAEAKGGVLFVDEAYRLNSDVFGVEAINGLMKAMTVKGTVMILAGYTKQMDDFINANPGLKRRITYEMTFPEYEPEDLAQILKTQIAQRGYQTDVPLDELHQLITSNTSPAQRKCFNGGMGEHIARHAIFNLNESQVPLAKNARAKNQEFVPSIVLRYKDIEHGCENIPVPPVTQEPISATRRRSWVPGAESRSLNLSDWRPRGTSENEFRRGTSESSLH